MRVALINNMNNNFFAFTRYLRDLGADAHLFIIDPLPEHFLPMADTFENAENLHYIHYLDGNAMRQYNLKRLLKFKRQLKKVYADLATFDVIIGCGNLAYFALNGIRIDIFMPYAGDAFQLIEQHKLSHRKGIIYLYHYFLAYLQRKAIKNTRVVMTLGSVDGNVRTALKKLNKGWVEGTVPMVYPLKLPKVSPRWEFLKKHDFVFFSHTRQSWYKMEDYKGNEKYIKAYARFVKTSCKFAQPILVLFEYGDTVAASKELIASLGIEQYVKWMPKMFRKEIFFGLSQASLMVDALTDTVASFGGAVFEAFMQAVPVIGTALIPGVDPNTHLPLIHAFTEEDVYQILLDYQADPAKYKQIGLNSQAWFIKNVGAEQAAQCYKLLELLQQNPNLTRESPDFNEKMAAAGIHYVLES